MTSDLIIFSKTKELMTLSLIYLEKFPKKQQFLVTMEIKKLINEIYQNLLRANEEWLIVNGKVNQNRWQRRQDRQFQALTALKLLDFYIEFSSQNKWISLKNQQNWSLKVLEVMKLTKAWIKSDLDRLGRQKWVNMKKFISGKA